MPALAPARSRLVAVAALVALLTGALTVTAGTAPAEAAVDSGMESQFACLINEARRAAGAPALRVANELTSVARRHSRVMADKTLLHHNPNLATDVTNWRRLSENVGRGSTVSSLHTAFMDSAGHRRNLLDTQVTEMGIGVEVRNGRIWVTEVFRRPGSAGATSLPDCGGNTAAGATTGGASTSRSVPVVGDWNGDGRATPGRFQDGRWTLRTSLDGTAAVTVEFGGPGDLPVVGDWNGDGRDTVGVMRGTEFLLRTTNTSGAPDLRFTFGDRRRGDVPVAGDWNGNGRDGIGIIRDREWHLRSALSTGPADHSFTFGRLTAGDRPLVGDWNADGRDTIGIVRQGEWHLRGSLSGGPGEQVFVYGRVLAGDLPLTGDWNGNGTSGVAIVRGGDWMLRTTLTSGNADRVLKH